MWNLRTFVQADDRICPTLPKWRELWDMLPEHEHVSSGCHPTMEQIETNWESTTDEEKQRWLSFHVDYAIEHGVEDQVTHFLVDLSQKCWHHKGDFDGVHRDMASKQPSSEGWTGCAG